MEEIRSCSKEEFVVESKVTAVLLRSTFAAASWLTTSLSDQEEGRLQMVMEAEVNGGDKASSDTAKKDRKVKEGDICLMKKVLIMTNKCTKSSGR